MTGIPAHEDYMVLNFEHARRGKAAAKNAGWEIDRAWNTLKFDAYITRKWYAKRGVPEKAPCWMRNFTY